MGRHRLFWILLAASLVLSACQPKSNAPTSSAPPAGASSLPAASSQAPAAVLPVSASWVDNDETKEITIKNVGSSSLTVNQVVVNGLVNDSDCDIKVFKALAVGEEVVVKVPRCGRFTKFSIVGDGGSRDVVVSQLQTDISVSNFTGVDKTVRVFNTSSSEYMLNSIVFNDTADDSNCNVKVFRKIEKHSYIDVPQNCGALKSAKLIFEDGTLDLTFNSN